MENVINSVTVSVVNILKGASETTTTLQLQVGEKQGRNGGEPKPVYASIRVNGKSLTIDEAIAHMRTMDEVNWKLPTEGGTKIRLRLSAKMSGERAACLCAFANGKKTLQGVTDEKFLEHLESSGLTLIDETVSAEVQANVQGTASASPTPNVGNRESIIESATQTNPTKREKAKA
jgi:hypothetical protein